MLKKFFVKYLPLAVTLLGAAALSLESYLSLSHKSLCRSTACEVVGRYLTIGTPILVAAGALFFWFLALVLFFAGRYPDRLKILPFILLALALAIDSSLMGFQFFTIHQTCLLCISVATLLILITILYCYSTRSFVILTCLILVWTGGFAVHKIMIMPPPQGASTNMVFFTTGKAYAPPSNDKRQMTLIVSMNCPHCLEVISFLAGRYPLDIKIKLAAIDTDPLSLAKLNLFLQQAPTSVNPFKLLREIKEDTSSNANTQIPPTLKNQTQNGVNFLNNLGITNIPVLIFEPSPNEKKIMAGSTEIISFIESMKKP
jgi:hypothetical protein